MATGNTKSNANDTARPERRASRRLASDLLRFEKAFERLESGHMGLGADAEDTPPSSPIVEHDVQDYLNCLDEAIKQLAEEFAEDATVAKIAKQRDANEVDTPVAAESFASGSESTTVTATALAATTATTAITSTASPLPRPNCDAFDGRPCDATAATLAFSQVDTSAI
ncbi:MAG: hypothetical protein WD971_01250 [Pirellulales bacterium]